MVKGMFPENASSLPRGTLPRSTPSHYGVLICGHGSRDPVAADEFSRLIRRLRERMPQYAVEHGCLEFAQPDLRAGLDALRSAGVTRILAVPALLFAAGHVRRDIPALLERYEADHPDVTIHYGRELGVDPKMVRAAEDRIGRALSAASASIPLQDTLLLVVGRGATDADVNGNVIRIMRLLWEALGVGWGETCFAGNTFPLVEPALEHAVRLGYRRVIVFPYFLFTGVLMRRIEDATNGFAARFPGIDFVKATYLKDHPLVVETIAERVEEILEKSLM